MNLMLWVLVLTNLILAIVTIELIKANLSIEEGEDEMERIKIKYFTDDESAKVSKNGDWYDLRASEDVDLEAFEYKLIPLGVAMELPRGFEAIVAPRSSTFKNFGVIQANGIGIIDEAYRGDSDQWHFPAIALRKTHISKGDRICQFRILYHQQDIDFVEVELLGNQSRGGIGSTGVK